MRFFAGSRFCGQLKKPRMLSGIRCLILIPSQEKQRNAGSTLHRASSGSPRDVPQRSLALMLHSSAQIKHSFAALLVQDLKRDSHCALQHRYIEAIGKCSVSLTLFFNTTGLCLTWRQSGLWILSNIRKLYSAVHTLKKAEFSTIYFHLYPSSNCALYKQFWFHQAIFLIMLTDITLPMSI